MCKLVKMKIGKRYIKVADIKEDYIKNVIDSVTLCSAIDKVVLFGSALEERCTARSDLDIAIFGRYPKQKMYQMKSYNDFVDSVVSYGELQDYDMLYFDNTKQNKDLILQDIENGEILFERM